MNREFQAACLIVMLFSGACMAQGPLQRKATGKGDEGGLQVKDVEGTIWEFKVMDHDERDRSEKTKMTGRLRIKQTSVFAVGKVESQSNGGQLDTAQLMEKFDGNGDRLLNVNELDSLLAYVRSEASSASQADSKTGPSASGNVPGELKGLLSQRITKAKEEDSGGERIGDLTNNGPTEKKFRFDEDDNHPLSGIVVLQPDTANRNGSWYGYYDEFSGGKKIARWRFEMRKIEE
jgi:hypothetical protein